MKLLRVGKDWTAPRPELFAYDTESESLDPESRCLYISWSIEEGVGYCSTIEEMPPILLDWMQDKRVATVGHNLKHDWKVLRYATGIQDFEIAKPEDTRILRHVAAPCVGQPRFPALIAEKLKSQAMAIGVEKWTSPLERWQQKVRRHEVCMFCGGLPVPLELTKTKKVKLYVCCDCQTPWAASKRYAKEIAELPKSPWPPPPEILEPYTCADAAATWMLRQTWKRKSTPEAWRCYEIECMGIGFFVDAEMAGMRVDCAFLRNLAGELAAEADRLELRFKSMTRVDNLRSNPQLREWVYEREGVKCPRRTRKGGESLNDENIEALRNSGATPPHVLEALDVLLEYRGTKVRLDKCESLLHNADEEGIIHQSYNLTGTGFGRTSSGQKGGVPNVQNIERTGTGPLRFGFVSRF